MKIQDKRFNYVLFSVIMENMNTVNIKYTAKEGVKIPEYKTKGSAGADICAFISEDVTIEPGAFAMLPTGLFFEIPQGYEIQVRPRSGLAAKHGITVLNTPGTIDSDYRGEICVILINLGEEAFTIHNGDRIAQLIIAPVTQGLFVKAEKLEDSQRGSGGFGSTGV